VSAGGHDQREAPPAEIETAAQLSRQRLLRRADFKIELDVAGDPDLFGVEAE
jgi:hypothetical protein